MGRVPRVPVGRGFSKLGVPLWGTLFAVAAAPPKLTAGLDTCGVRAVFLD